MGISELEHARTAHEGGAWKDAYELLREADARERLPQDDLERLATAAYMLARNDEHHEILERLHRRHLEAGRTLPAVRAAFWLGMHLFTEGEMGRATGWLGRAERLIAEVDEDCVERGYLLIPRMFQLQAAGDAVEAAALAARAAEYGHRFGDLDLFSLALQSQGHLYIHMGRLEEGGRLLDEAMLPVTTGELSPIVSGIVYCGVILACQRAFDVRRAKEWTAALSRWCERQPDMVAFTGRCMVHRAEILQLDGAWEEALEEARTAGSRCLAARNRQAAGQAAYVEGELHRLQGDLVAAEEAYREASRWGREPQPGLSLLRLAQGDLDGASVAIGRALSETTDRQRRAALLPACVEIKLLAGAVDEARRACTELEDIAVGHERGMLGAVALQSRGAVELVERDARAALPPLRRALETWEEIGARYEAGRVRVLLAMACSEMGDEDAAALELSAARAIFAELGAKEDGPLEGLRSAPRQAEAHGLTPRELEVLRLVAAGNSNKAVAAELIISERTVHRHLSNIFAKLRVPSRAAATAYAYRHDLL